MAQLTDDCFAFSDRMITVAEARARLAESIAEIAPVAATETVPLTEAVGRVLARDVTADVAVPPYDNSAVDGYAFYADDLTESDATELPVVGRVAAGHPLGRALRRGEAVQIFTGAPMPAGESGTDGPDTVAMLEDCEAVGERVRLPAGLARGANRRHAGEDVAVGARVLTRGTRLRPQEVGMLAAVGLAEAPVYAPLTVALFSTGDEVAEPGASLPEGRLYDSNRFTIGAALAALGYRVADYGILPDEAEPIRRTMTAAAARADAVVATGGMSMGEEDHVRAAVEAEGALAFWRVAVKPGRPVGLGLVADGRGGRTPFVGLPGNPVAALTTFIAVARPLLAILQGASPAEPPRHAVAMGFAYAKKPGRREFVRVRLAPAAEGAADAEQGGPALPRALKHGRGGAAMLSSLVGADGFVDLAEDRTQIEEGEPVPFLPFSEVLS